MLNNRVVQIGQVVKVLRGKDAGSLAVVIDLIDEKFVRIADGNVRKFDQSKRKSLQHLELMPWISEEVVNSLRESGRVTNGKLRHAVISFEEITDTITEEKGD